MTLAREAESILERIRAETPEFWPHGLDRNNLEAGCWLMRKRASNEPVGFIGLQNRPVDGKNIGYYAIGVLPEYRRQGYAEQALRTLMAEKRATCDEFRAFIVPTNGPSLALARKLNIPVQHKSAACRSGKSTPAFPMGEMIKQAVDWGRLGKFGLRTLLPTVAADVAFNPNAYYGDGHATDNAGARLFSGAVNSFLFHNAFRSNPLTRTVKPGKPISPVERGALLGLVPTKDLAIQAGMTLADNKGRIGRALDTAGQGGTNLLSQLGDMASKHKLLAGGAAVGGAGLLGLAGLLGYKGVRALENAGQQGGRLKVTLPTRNPGDQETTIEMPFNQINLTPTAISRVTRDLRRRLRAEGKSRTGKRTLADQAVVAADEADANTPLQ